MRPAYLHKPKLTSAQIVKMRRLHAEGWATGRLAKEFGVSRSCAYRKVRRLPEPKEFSEPAEYPRVVPVKEAGLRIGEEHPRAKLTDAEVERIRSLHEDEEMTYKALAEKFEVSWHCIGRICRYERRAQTPAEWKTIKE